MTDVTRDAATPEEGALYAPGQHVVEDRRDSRIGIVISAWDAEPPILYKLAGATDPKPWLAWERHLRPATPAEAATYEANRAAGAGPRAGARVLGR